MNRPFLTRFRRVVAGGLLVALVAVAAACDTGEALDETELASTELTALAEDLTQELSLSTEAAQDLRAAFATHEGRAGEPGFLWYVARDLQQSLSDEQKEKLFARMDQRGERWFRRGERPGFGRRGGPMSGRFGDRPRGDGPVAEVLASLTDEQKEAMQAVRETYRPQLQALMQQRRDGTLAPDAVREQMTTLREAMRAEIDAIFTPEQKAALEAARADVKARAEERHDAAQAVMTEVLGLTAAQQADLEALKEEMRAEMQTLREQVQAGTLERDAVRDAFSALHEARMEAMAEILTAEQVEIVKIHRVLMQHQGRRMAKRAMQRRGGPGGFGPFGDGPGN